MNDSNHSVPVIILNWNNASDTIAAVQSVLRQDYHSFRIILADNGSSPEDFQLLNDLFSGHKQIQILRFSENLGFTKAHNRILRDLLQEDIQYVALLNNDAVAEKHWLSSMISCVYATGAGIVASCMKQQSAPELMDNAGLMMLNTGEILPLGNGEPVKKFSKPFHVFGASGGAALYSVPMLRDIGLFDEAFGTGYEDAELALRAQMAGYNCVYEPQAIVSHKGSVSVEKIRDFEYLSRSQQDILYTSVKLLPAFVLIVNFPFIVFRLFFITVFSVLFLRFRIIRVMWHSHFSFLMDRRKAALAGRKSFSSGRIRTGALVVLSKMQFFLWFDIRRFVRHYLRGKITQPEKY